MLFIALSFLDLHSTYLCESSPSGVGEEANPIFKWAMERWGLIYGLIVFGSILKISAFLISLLALRWLFGLANSINERKVRAFCCGAIVAGIATYLSMSAAVVINNYMIAFGHV